MTQEFGTAAAPAKPASEAGSRAIFGWTLAIVLVASLSVTLYPAWVIRPFRAQGARELAISLALLRVAPWITLAALAMGLLVSLKLWTRALSRAAVIAALALLAASAWLARTDYFEFVFRPDPTPQVVSADAASLEPGDMVMLVRAGGQARAYPIRMMAYHHLVNDSLAGVPLLPTY